MLTHFKGSLLFTVACLGVAALVAPSGHLLSTLWIVAVLGLLETSLSFDNAVVNAKVLAGMSPVWRRRFLTWGIAIAVFGMRIVFPLAIVGFAAWLGPLDAISLAINDERRYAEILHHAHPQIAAFGGAFLLLVCLQFFIDAEKDEHWLPGIEAPMAALGRALNRLPAFAVEGGIVCVALLVSLWAARYAPDPWLFMRCAMYGIATWIAVEIVGAVLNAESATGIAGKSGLAGFLYLEILDASFSFDGVIGAFALSANLFVIALGLGIGAMFVRSMTVFLVEKGTLAEYRYLEHGAFWAIGALAAVMLASPAYQVPEAVTGLTGAVLIGAGWLSSVVVNRRQATASL